MNKRQVCKHETRAKLFGQGSYKKVLFLGLILMVGIFFLSACSDDKEKKAVVAYVNDLEITGETLDKRFNLVSSQYNFDSKNKEHQAFAAELKNQILESLIDEAVLLEEAAKRGYQATAEAVEEEVEFFKARFSSEADFEDYLATYISATKEEFHEIIGNDLTISALFAEVTATVTETATSAKDYYEANKDQFVYDAEVLASHILVDTEEEALDLLEQIKAGADINELAYEHSTDPSAQNNFGNLGWFGRGVMLPEFEEAVFSLEVGQLYPQPVKSDFGYHIIYLEDKDEGGLQTFAELKDDIEAMLLEVEKNEFFVDFIDSLRDQADIKMNNK